MARRWLYFELESEDEIANVKEWERKLGKLGRIKEEQP